MRGLLSDLIHKNAESIAYFFGQARASLQWFLGTSSWDRELLRDELVRRECGRDISSRIIHERKQLARH